MIPPPQLGHRSPPVLVDDAVREIFLRVPPDDPATLARASAVCTAWRDIISDAPFGREYRAFHGAPPVLGFLQNSSHDLGGSRFTSMTASLRSPACHDREDWYALDSRHGLVLFHTHHECEDIIGFAVCDLITHEQWSVPAPPRTDWLDVEHYWNAAVLRARVDLRDHLDCNDEGAFLVALVGTDYGDIVASVYSSEAGEWSNTISIKKPISYLEIHNPGHTAIVGNKVYLTCGETGTDLIMEYDMGAQELAVLGVPFVSKPGTVLVGAEDGILLYAAAEESQLYLWSVDPGRNGTVRRRVIDLEPSLPRIALCSVVSVAGFAVGAGVIVLRADVGLFTVELSSCHIYKK